jgi:hypothetical protein
MAFSPWYFDPMAFEVEIRHPWENPMAINTTGMMVLSNGVTHLIAMAQYHMLSHGVTQLFSHGIVP